MQERGAAKLPSPYATHQAPSPPVGEGETTCGMTHNLLVYATISSSCHGPFGVSNSIGYNGIMDLAIERHGPCRL
jgi:hypothetical protein